jgi:hypothetical protein
MGHLAYKNQPLGRCVGVGGRINWVAAGTGECLCDRLGRHRNVPTAPQLNHAAMN